MLIDIRTPCQTRYFTGFGWIEVTNNQSPITTCTTFTDITFIKVKAHSDNQFNDLANSPAKQGVHFRPFT
ncbi:uncharacterized protein OCT59_016856 [Rhizophagus irregularis]|uniref:uncharacterized protein n=1 Tax=Rhizophagus irregularis TaxID=588596 RepID=UPI00331A5B0C|nr:hypothetical protein OCT59_016856 [Rhizophagus irregularis]